MRFRASRGLTAACQTNTINQQVLLRQLQLFQPVS
jgi:hypothetical protein